MGLKKDLTFFDLTNIIIGSIVGADIYVVAGIVAGLVGPIALAVWIVAGIMAMSLALVLAYCSYYVPHVGGPFAFVSTAFSSSMDSLQGGAYGLLNSSLCRSMPSLSCCTSTISYL
jgi:amino acid transporter